MKAESVEKVDVLCLYSTGIYVVCTVRMGRLRSCRDPL